MSSTLLLTLMLLAPPSETSVVRTDRAASSASASSSATADRLRDRDALRDEYRQAMRKSAKRLNPDPKTMVPELVGLYNKLSKTMVLSPLEQKRLKRGVAVHLKQMQDRLRRGIARSRTQTKRRGRGSRTRQPGQVLAGGTTASNALELIDLIQSTICPDRWDVNGGNGSIRFFSPLNVIVVR